MSSYVINEIETLINEIKQTPVVNININTNKIQNKFHILEALIKQEPININMYGNYLIQINGKDKCIKCQRDACYLNQSHEKLCWIHSQNLNL
jgi:hypothetical protein